MLKFMKLPVTDRFLCDIYEFIEKIDRSYDFFSPRTMKEALSPELFKLKREYERKKMKKDFRQFVYYLKKNGYIKIKNLENTKGVMLTPKGVERVLQIKSKSEKKERKDGKWQMVAFDIPEKKRSLRDVLRENLIFLGYQKLQNSVWVCPYDVAKETESVIRQYNLDRYIRIFLIEKIRS